MQPRLLTALLLGLVAACGQPSPPENSVPPAPANGDATYAPAPTPQQPDATEPPAEETPLELVGTSWVALEIDGRPATGGQSTLEFMANGKAAGRAGCNRYSGGVELHGPSIRFSDQVSTKMACPAPQMEQEQRFLNALQGVSSLRLQRDELLLLDASGAVRMRLRPASGDPGDPAQKPAPPADDNEPRKGGSGTIGSVANAGADRSSRDPQW